MESNMIQIKKKEVVATFGTGDILMGVLEDKKSIFLSNLETGMPIGTSDIGPVGEKASVLHEPIFLTFNKIESLDVLIDVLQHCRDNYGE